MAMGRYGEAIERIMSWNCRIEEEKGRLFGRAEELGYSEDEIRSSDRSVPLPYIRMSIAYRLCRMGVSVHGVARILNRNRTTILFYVRCIEETYMYNKELAQVYDALARKEEAE